MQRRGWTLQTRWFRHHHRVIPAARRSTATLAPTIAAIFPALCRAEAPPAVAANSPISTVVVVRLGHAVRWRLYNDGYKMPPVDRNNPIRAKSSDSRVSFMEFLRDYPDDRA